MRYHRSQVELSIIYGAGRLYRLVPEALNRDAVKYGDQYLQGSLVRVLANKELQDALTLIISQHIAKVARILIGSLILLTWNMRQ
jgi:hypothetical protein